MRQTAAQPLIDVKDIVKHFGSVIALRRVDGGVARARCTACSATTAPASRR